MLKTVDRQKYISKYYECAKILTLLSYRRTHTYMKKPGTCRLGNEYNIKKAIYLIATLQ